ncbi:MAG TPA: ACT domain-containing protein [Candidatus Omnitrophota bacterium]|nr:ACT domain-containing protein [Candidatus Omnitrophota bacterium]HQO37224.1 ACT domain-containing protein [Candidatus Omnitrophota bacterium]HQQ05381.1 ACT domain-containing protein [Candidatus Omnitrophota bacterium]
MEKRCVQMKKELSFITVIGRDQKGIVAKISDLLYKNDINIEDISQKVMEGVFVMTMLVDVSGYKKPSSVLAGRLEAIGSSMGLKIQIQHENIFKRMHRV